MKFLLPFLVSLISLFCFSQEETKEDLLANTKRNTFYTEVGGQGLVYSLNYDRLLSKKNVVSTSFSIGASYWGVLFDQNIIKSRSVFALPISYNYLFGKKNHHLELGLGISPIYFNIDYYDLGKYQDYTTFMFIKTGYRYQKLEGGMFFKTIFTPMIFGWSYNSGKEDFFPWAGISVGYTLKN